MGKGGCVLFFCEDFAGLFPLLIRHGGILVGCRLSVVVGCRLCGMSCPVRTR